MNIVDFIPYGEENGVTRLTLCMLTGLNDREVRDMIARARLDRPILNFQGGKGYFLPTENEPHLTAKWIRQEEARAKSIFRNMRGARKAV